MSSLEPDRGTNACNAVLLGTGTEVRLADAGLARFMHRDYVAAESSVGAFTWTVRPPLERPAPKLGMRCLPRIRTAQHLQRGGACSLRMAAVLSCWTVIYMWRSPFLQANCIQQSTVTL